MIKIINLIEHVSAATASVAPITPDTTTYSFADLVARVVLWITYIAGAAAFIYLVYSGILYISAAGNPDQAKKGQQGIINAVIGIIVIVLAYTIINIAKQAGRGDLGLPNCTARYGSGTSCPSGTNSSCTPTGDLHCIND